MINVQEMTKVSFATQPGVSLGPQLESFKGDDGKQITNCYGYFVVLGMTYKFWLGNKLDAGGSFPAAGAQCIINGFLKPQSDGKTYKLGYQSFEEAKLVIPMPSSTPVENPQGDQISAVDGDDSNSRFKRKRDAA